MAEQYDSEITLGVGRLLILFFGLVVLFGIFLGLGYTMGRNSVKLENAANTPDGVPTGNAVTGNAKPGAGQNGAQPKSADCPEGQNCTTGGTPEDLTFYKAVGQKDANTQLTPATDSGDAAAQKPGTTSSAPEMKSPAGSGYMVQVAAVSKREDAEALTDALRKKQYPVVIINTPTDKLFHVQLGPFADVKDAEAMKGRLVSDGYNPIVKK